jgi:hypothetical protein
MTAQTIDRSLKPANTKDADRPRWLSYPEAVELSTWSVRSLKRLTAAGRLPCYVVGAKVLRLKASDVEALFVPADQCRRWQPLKTRSQGNGEATHPARQDPPPRSCREGLRFGVGKHTLSSVTTGAFASEGGWSWQPPVESLVHC